MGEVEIAVITTSMNYGKYIEQNIESILNQEGNFKIRHLVLDGGSADHTVDVFLRYQGKADIIYWRGLGQTDAINLAWELIQADYPNVKYIGWINADDYYLPTFFKESVKELESQPSDVAATCGDVIFEYPDIDKKPDRSVRRIQSEYIPRETMARGNFIWCPTILMRRNVLDKIKKGKPLVKSRFNQDYILWAEILAAGYRIYYNKHALVVHRIHDRQLGKLHPTENRKEHFESVEYVRKILGGR